MLSFLIWLLLAAGSMVIERVLAPRSDGGAQGEAVLTDGLLKTSIVFALAGPLLLAAVLPVSPLFGLVIGGGALGAFGVAFRAWAIRSLGRRFQLTPMQQSHQHYLVVDGPYRIVRHPGYFAFVCQFVGMAVLFSNPWAALFVLPVMVALIYRVKVEERLLRAEFITTYGLYEQSVRWRVIPWIY